MIRATIHHMRLLSEKELRTSSVVANCFMNRERQAFGDNSYEKDVHLNPRKFLMDRFHKKGKLTWLDVCCGRGRALIQTMNSFIEEQADQRFELWGVDLVGMFDPIPDGWESLTLIESSLIDFNPKTAFDLITCVHGLHYIGDKLGIIIKYIQYLKKDGLYIANLDTNNILDGRGNKLGRRINSFLRSNGLEYDARKKLIICRGKKEFALPFKYLGADDRFGKNYTGQEAVASYYDTPV